ncbi:MAG TPA: hypothetical protein VHR43_17235 [Gemmatimonadales bacterium]|nr:hypothetical protein [Gemmatimonadales bacterium]
MSERNLSVAAAVAFAVVAMVAGCRAIGLPPVVIVGGSSAIGLVMWLRTTGGRAVDPDLILPPFLLTVAALETHMAEEYLTPRPAAHPAGRFQRPWAAAAGARTSCPGWSRTISTRPR